MQGAHIGTLFSLLASKSYLASKNLYPHHLGYKLESLCIMSVLYGSILINQSNYLLDSLLIAISLPCRKFIWFMTGMHNVVFESALFNHSIGAEFHYILHPFLFCCEWYFREEI